MMVRVGMPETSKTLLSCSLRLSPCGIAWKPDMEPKYFWKSPIERSEETKIISSCLPAALTALTVSTSLGVNAWHGGHHDAEKYSPITLPGPRRSETGTVSPSWLITSSPRASHSVGGFHGKLAPSGS